MRNIQEPNIYLYFGMSQARPSKDLLEGTVALISAGMGSKSSLTCGRGPYQFLPT